MTFSHTLKDLDRNALRDWLALFLGGGQGSHLGISYPLLYGDQTPMSWVIHQCRKHTENSSASIEIRAAIVELIQTEKFPVHAEHDQLLGALVEIAGACGFTEIIDVCSGWIQGDRYRDLRYVRDSRTVYFRTLLWEILIGWKAASRLIPQLVRDLSPTDQARTTLCFAELGRIAPDEAIRALPEVVRFPFLYWYHPVREFLDNSPLSYLLGARLQPAWTSALNTIAFDSGTVSLLATGAVPGKEGALVRVFEECGGELRLSATGIHITARSHPMDEMVVRYHDSLGVMTGSFERIVNAWWARNGVDEALFSNGPEVLT